MISIIYADNVVRYVYSFSEITNHESVKGIYCVNKNISSLDGIEKCINIRYLNCSYNKIISIEQIADCTNLIDLNISNNLISDINCLRKCTKLESLNASSNKLKKIPFFIVTFDKLLSINIDKNNDCSCNFIIRNFIDRQNKKAYE